MYWTSLDCDVTVPKNNGHDASYTVSWYISLPEPGQSITSCFSSLQQDLTVHQASPSYIPLLVAGSLTMKAMQVSALIVCLCVAIEAFPFGGMYPGGMYNPRLGPWGPRFPYRRPSPYRNVRPRPAVATTTTTTTTTTTPAPVTAMPPHQPYRPAQPYAEPELYVYDGGYNDGFNSINNGYDSQIVLPNAGPTTWNGQTIVVIHEDHPTPKGRQARMMNTQGVQTGALPQMMNTQGVQAQMINRQGFQAQMMNTQGVQAQMINRQGVQHGGRATGAQQFADVPQNARVAATGSFQASAQLPAEQFNTQTQIAIDSAAANPTQTNQAPASSASPAASAASASVASASSGTQNPAAEPIAEPTNQMDAMVRNYIMSEMEHGLSYDSPIVAAQLGQNGQTAGLDLNTLQRMHMYEALDLPAYAAFQSGPGTASAAEAAVLQASL